MRYSELRNSPAEIQELMERNIRAANYLSQKKQERREKKQKAILVSIVLGTALSLFAYNKCAQR